MNEKKKIKIFCSWGLSFDFESETQVELYVDTIPPSPHDGSSIRFLFLLEPPTFLNLTNQVLENQHLFNYVFTHNDDVLNSCKKSILFEHGMSWIKNYEFKEKKFEISTVVGFKMISEGHAIRRGLWHEQKRITCPKKFFLSNQHRGLEDTGDNPVLGSNMEDKIVMFDSQFHIAIESTKRNNYFTEKLIDALITKTVPIYYGCPNIGKWFDIKGMFRVNGVEDIISVCNGVNREMYSSMIPVIEENFERAKKYVDIGERLKDKINEIITNKNA